MIDDDIARAIALGERNQEALTLASNWCAHLDVKLWGGVGLLEANSGLPIGSRYFRCRYAVDDGVRYTELHDAALQFYDQNCNGCAHRKPVRLPNLLELVRRRDAKRTQEQKERDRIHEAERLAFEERDSQRNRLRADVDATTAGLIDLIRDLDSDPTDENAQRLVGAATASPDHFLDPIVNLLYDLLLAGKDVRVASILKVLDRVETNRPRVAHAALRAVSEGVAVPVAATVGTRDLKGVSTDDVRSALPSLIHLAECDRQWPSAAVTDPGPLLQTYAEHAELVEQQLKIMLRSSLPADRRAACKATEQVGLADPQLPVVLVDDLVRAVLIPDREYGGFVRVAAAITLGSVFRQHPERVDAVLRSAAATSTAEDRRHLFSVVDRSMRLASDDAEGGSFPTACDIAIQHVIEALARPDDDRLVREAVELLQLIATSWPGAVVPHTESLLGCAALLATAFETSEESLVDKAIPEALVALTASSRRMALNHALSEVVDVVGMIGARFSETAGRKMCEVFDGTGDASEHLQAAIVRGLGRLCRTPAGLSLGLPYLYRALVHSSQVIRSHGATAYGDVLQVHGDDLPDLVHEAFLPLLSDPYVIVHEAALQVNCHKLSSRFKRRLLDGIVGIFTAYAASRSNDRILATATQRLVWLSRDTTLPIDRVLPIVATMDPGESTRIVDTCGQFFRGVDGYAELIVSLILDPRTWSHCIPNLVDELRELSPAEIRRVVAELPKAAIEARRQLVGEFGVPEPTSTFLDVLVRASAWKEAAAVARDQLDELGHGSWDTGARLGAEALVVAVELEKSLGQLAINEAIDLISRWRAIGQEIEVFNETQEKRSG